MNDNNNVNKNKSIDTQKNLPSNNTITSKDCNPNISCLAYKKLQTKN